VFDKVNCFGKKPLKDNHDPKDLNLSFDKLNLTGSKSDGRFLYEPREATSKAVRQFEQKTGQSWYQLSPESRAHANQILKDEQKLTVL